MSSSAIYDIFASNENSDDDASIGITIWPTGLKLNLRTKPDVLRRNDEGLGILENIFACTPSFHSKMCVLLTLK